jgi:hypothetical protein
MITSIIFTKKRFILSIVAAIVAFSATERCAAQNGRTDSDDRFLARLIRVRAAKGYSTCPLSDAEYMTAEHDGFRRQTFLHHDCTRARMVIVADSHRTSYGKKSA